VTNISRPHSNAREHLCAGDLVLQRFRVLSQAGAGGFATVHFVEDESTRTRYVLKLLDPTLAKRAVYRKRFARETQALQRLGVHPNIVKIVTSGTTLIRAIETPFYVMEALEGCTLAQYQRGRGAMALSDAVSIGVQLLDALAHVHACGLIHRDVKPENIFLAVNELGKWTIKLLDFGISLWREIGGGPSASLTTAGAFLGTPRWASPEQFLGERVGPKADLYSVGLLLFWMIAGRSPFSEDRSAFSLSAAHIYEPPPRLNSLVPSIAPELDDLVARALAKKADDRPIDAAAFSRRLRAIGEAVAPRPSTLTVDCLRNVDRRSVRGTQADSVSSFIVSLARAESWSPPSHNGNETRGTPSARPTTEEGSPIAETELRRQTGDGPIAPASVAPRLSPRARAMWVLLPLSTLLAWWVTRDEAAPRQTPVSVRSVVVQQRPPSEIPATMPTSPPFLVATSARAEPPSSSVHHTQAMGAGTADRTRHERRSAAPPDSDRGVGVSRGDAGRFTDLLSDDPTARVPWSKPLVAGELLSE
jgi:serine/threonine protein kinase